MNVIEALFADTFPYQTNISELKFGLIEHSVLNSKGCFQSKTRNYVPTLMRSVGLIDVVPSALSADPPTKYKTNADIKVSN